MPSVPPPLSAPCIPPWRNGWCVLYAAICLVPAWLCVVLLRPGPLFSSNENYRILAALAPEAGWAVFFGAVACFGAFGLLGRSLLLRRLSCAALCAINALVALCFGLANPFSAGTGLCAILATLALLRLVRIGHDDAG